MTHKRLGQEYLEPHEFQQTETIVKAIKKRLLRDYKPGKVRRQFHAKMHAFVKASFTIEAELPKHLQHGIFIPGKSYDAWIRFSNGSTRIQEDGKADLRGMSIKIETGAGEIQDFLLVTYPTLMAPNVSEFSKVIQALCGGPWAMLAYAANPFHWPVFYRTLSSLKKHSNLFSESFYSVSPYRLGPPEQAVKYAIQAGTGAPGLPKDKKNPNFLREVMQEDLLTKTIAFDFMVQLQEDADAMPIENTCIKWTSPFIKVAGIQILPQQFCTKERNALGENMSFAPWHCLKEHQPLGGVNRARRAVYLAIAQFRLEQNKLLNYD